LRGSCLAVAALTLLPVSPALGQYSAMITACQSDIKHRCAGVLPEGGRLGQCMKANFLALAEPCRAALVRTAAVREACAADIRQQCPTAKPGAGSILLCVKAHYAALSESCKDAMDREAERGLRAH